MPLDPKAREFLDQLEAAGGPPLTDLPVATARLAIDALFASQGEVEPVARVEDRRIPGPGGEIPIRVYTPEGKAPFPVLVFIHGGGWVLCSLDSHDPPCRALANAVPCVVVSVDYRLAPEHKFPASADDAWTATKWVAAHAAELGVDAAKLAVGGDSAGGNLAAVVALQARDAGAPKIGLQVLLYPVTDVGAETQSYRDLADGYMLTREGMRWFIAHYLGKPQDAEDWRASPARAKSFAGVAPALVITAGYDPLRDEGDAYAQKLRAAGVNVDQVSFGGMIHGFVPMGKLIETGNRAVTLIAGSLRHAFR